MIYLVNEYIVAMNSGIEHSEMQRVKMFSENKESAKIVTRNYDRLTAQYVKRFELPQNSILNMFDYFQEATNISSSEPNYPKIESLNLAAEYNVDPGADVSHVYEGDQLVYDVHFAPGTVGQLFAVDVYNNKEIRMQSTLYDVRGFKSRDQFFDQRGNLITQYSYSPSGERKIEEFFAKNEEGQSYMSLIHLLDYKDQDLYFNNYDELFVYFLDQLNQDNPKSIFIADRPGTSYNAVLNMKTNPKRFATIPTPHSSNPKDQVFGDLSKMYADILLQRADSLNGVIVATEEQKHDLTKWMGGAKLVTTPIKQASFGVVSDTLLENKIVPLKDRESHKLIFVGRATENQRLEKLINVFKLVHNQLSDVTLDVYGYGERIKDLNEKIKEDKLDKVIKFKGYQADLSKAYDTAQLFVSTTLSDAQSLSIIEALSHGTPVVAFDTKYGPVGLVDDETGKLVVDGDETTMAINIIQILSDQGLWNEKSAGARRRAQQYSASKVFRQWKKGLR